MTNDADRDAPTNDPEPQSGSQPPASAPPPTPAQNEIRDDPNSRTNNQDNTARELAREFRWVEFAQLFINGALAIIGIFALCIYHGQLQVMRGQLGEIIKQYPEIQKSANAAKSAADTATSTLQSAQNQFRTEQRPIIWATNQLGQPELAARSGQILWDVQFTNYGKTPAHGLKMQTFLKVGKKPWKISYGTNLERYAASAGIPMPPGKFDFCTSVSEPGITKDQFQKLIGTDHAVRIRVVFEYTDAYGGKYESGLCFSRLQSGAINYCSDHNYIK